MDANNISSLIAVVNCKNVLIVPPNVPVKDRTLELTKFSVAIGLPLYLGWTVKSHWPGGGVLPAIVMLPDTSSLLAMFMFCMVAVPTVALLTFAVEMVAFVMLAVGKMAVPVNVASFIVALSRCNGSSAFFRSVIS